MPASAFEIGTATVTLRGINRVGLSDWKRREWWLGKKVFIWSREHSAFWRENARGYTTYTNDAGVYDFADAYEHTKHCGPEKKIEFIAVRAR